MIARTLPSSHADSTLGAIATVVYERPALCLVAARLLIAMQSSVLAMIDSGSLSVCPSVRLLKSGRRVVPAYAVYSF